jgi:putative ABC transport system ATP-binding protein
MTRSRPGRTDGPGVPEMTPTGHSPLAVCQAVSRTFGSGDQAVVAVHSVSCQISEGDRIAVMGASGSGKSTLLHLVAGLDRPSAGSITWPALATTANRLGDSVAMVFQGASLMPPLTVLENVAMPHLRGGMGDQQARLMAASALGRLDVEGFADRLPEELSGGQAQRVCVARAVAGHPLLILADEPTGQLDSVNATHIVDVLIQAADGLGAGLVISTHDPLVADRLATRWSMHDGVLTRRPRPAPPERNRSEP